MNHLENIGDTVANDLLSLGRDRLRTGLRVSPGTRKVLEPLPTAVVRACDLVLEAFGNRDVEKAQRVVDMKAEIRGLSAAAKDHLTERLAAEAPHRLRAFRLESDAVEYMKHVFYFTRRIAKVITGRREREREVLE